MVPEGDGVSPPGEASRRTSPATDFPPPPWRLQGEAYLGLWQVDARALPRDRIPAAARPVTIGHRGFIATMWVDYQDGGVLAYQEFLVAVVGRVGARPCLTTTDIWVNSMPSMVGGRTLWGIPKDLAAFSIRHGRRSDFEMDVEGKGRVDGSFRTRWTLPFTVPISGLLVQELDGVAHRVRFRSRCGMRFGHADLAIHMPGLEYLTDARPIVSCGLPDFRAVFGS